MIISGLVSLFVLNTLSMIFFNHSSTEREITSAEERQTPQSPKMITHTTHPPPKKQALLIPLKL
jgi:hypothetical protein